MHSVIWHFRSNYCTLVFFLEFLVRVSIQGIVQAIVFFKAGKKHIQQCKLFCSKCIVLPDFAYFSLILWHLLQHHIPDFPNIVYFISNSWNIVVTLMLQKRFDPISRRSVASTRSRSLLRYLARKLLQYTMYIQIPGNLTYIRTMFLEQFKHYPSIYRQACLQLDLFL